MPLATGQTLARYEIRAPLGAGGMGEVYRAHDPGLGRDVAIKVLPSEFVEDYERMARFEREARSLAALNHSSVAQIYGFEESGGIWFIAMELVTGEELGDRLARGPLPVDEALKLCARIADGLEAAHEIGVVHRDLKPGNVVLAANDRPKVLDFGLAARVERSPSGTPTPTGLSAYDQLTSTGLGMGSPGYMSPEQARGRPFDRRTDLFAFGCVLYECLTGTRAFAGETAADAVAALLSAEPDWSRLPKSTPRRVRELLARCLAKDPEERQRDAGDAALELRAALDDPAPADAPATARSGAKLILAGLIGVAAGALGFAWVRSDDRAPEAPARTLRFDVELPVPLAVSDRMMNEIAIGPNGSPIVFVGEQGNRVGMYAHDLRTGETTELDLGENARGAILSPDGRSLGFIQEFEHLAVASADGTGVRRVATLHGGIGGTGAWTSDGCIAIPDMLGSGLVFYPVNGGAAPDPVPTRAPMLGFDNVAPVPGERWLLASAWTGDTIDDYLVVSIDPATGELRTLIEHGSSPTVMGGRYLLFLRGTSLMAAPFDKKTCELRGEPKLVLAGVAVDDWGGSGQFAVSAEGTLVYAPGRRRSEGRRLVWASPDGATEAILGEDSYVGGVELAGDGKHLLFTTLRHRRELWCLDLERDFVSPVGGLGESYLGVIDPDQRTVYYNAVVEGVPQLRAASVGGGGEKCIARGPFAPTAISSDGARLYVTRGDLDGGTTGSDIVTFDLATEGPQPMPFMQGAHDEFSPALSPDGRWLAYGSNRSGRAQVFLRALEGDQEWRVADVGWAPRWAPDGRSLYYIHELALMRVDVELEEGRANLGQRTKVMESLSFASEEEYGVAADGRIAMIELAEWERAPKRLKVITGWLTEVDRLFSAE